MRFVSPLVAGRLVRRYKRFLADVVLEDGTEVTAHTANPGRMLGLTEPGRRVFLSRSNNPSRKLPYTWEVLELEAGRVGVNPMLANELVAEALSEARIAEASGYARTRREVRYGSRRSRIDFLLEADPTPEEPHGRPPCYLEVKNVTLLAGGGAQFPDAVTERGRKHLLELQDQVQAGARALVLFVVQRPEPTWVGPAEHIDPRYAEALRAAVDAGVELCAYRAEVGAEEIRLSEPLPLRLGPTSRPEA